MNPSIIQAIFGAALAITGAIFSQMIWVAYPFVPIGLAIIAHAWVYSYYPKITITETEKPKLGKCFSCGANTRQEQL